jgi:probable FeS assembly SUF system protein SufT
MTNPETIALKRDCRAVMIPFGNTIVIPQGTEVTITQSLGDSFTVNVGGNLARIEGPDADALGKTPAETPEPSASASQQDVETRVWDQLRTCFDPEIPVNIVDLGLVYNCNVADLDGGQRKIEVVMTLTAPGCGMGDVIAGDAQRKLEALPTVGEVSVEVVFEPPWAPEMMSDAAKLQMGML